jgi:hypothetical protein
MVARVKTSAASTQINSSSRCGMKLDAIVISIRSV